MGKSEKGNTAFRNRLNQLANKFDSVTAFAAYLGLSRQTVGFWLNGDRVPDANSLATISKKMGVSCDWLLGLTDAANPSSDVNIRAVAEGLGLNEESIKFLRELQKIKNDYDSQESVIDIAAEWTVTDKPIPNPEKPVVQGFISDELQFIVNWLLSHSRGQRLLTWISKYCSISGTDAYMLDDYNPDLLETYTKCDMLHYRNGSGWTMVNPAVIINGMLYTITTELSECRNDIQNGK